VQPSRNQSLKSGDLKNRFIGRNNIMEKKSYNIKV